MIDLNCIADEAFAEVHTDCELLPHAASKKPVSLTARRCVSLLSLCQTQN
jgi:hypothetical protein